MVTISGLQPTPDQRASRVDLRSEYGPFDIIGDIHGCYDELEQLLLKLGYSQSTGMHWSFVHPEGRKLVFLGDLVDRGPKITQVLKLVMEMTGRGLAFCVPGNHDIKFLRKLQGRDIAVKHGLAESLAQMELESPEFSQRVCAFLDGLVSHHVLDAGRLVVAHAGIKESMHGMESPEVRKFALFGETTGETDEFGLPVRYNWAAEYEGKAIVVYGHTPIPTPEWVNNTINLDTGCVYGGKLTALRYPEKELISVPAKRIYAPSKRPFLTGKLRECRM